VEQKQIQPKQDPGKKVLVIILSVIGVLVFLSFIAGTVYGWKKYSQKKKEMQSLERQIKTLKQGLSQKETGASGASTISESPVSTDDYAGWKTYTNSEIGYTLKYPADWTIKETSEFSPVRDATVKYITVNTPGKKYFLHWGLKEKGDSFYISDRTGMGAGEEKKTGKITILGTEVDINNFVFKGKAKEIFYPTAGSFPTSNGKYEFTATLSYGSGSNWDTVDLSSVPEKALAEKILKSVTLSARSASAEGCSQSFTNEENLNKADWKTVSNSKNGYSLKYPKSWSINEKKDDYLQMGNDENAEYFEWRSGPMTGTDYMGYKEDSHKNISVGCQSAKITYFSGDPTADPPGDAKDRLILVQFEKSRIPHVIIFTYKYFGASISSDIVEMFNLTLKTAEFNK